MEPIRTKTELTDEGFDIAFSQLLTAWQAHQTLRASRTPTAELFASHMSLDRHREQISHLRTPLPEDEVKRGSDPRLNCGGVKHCAPTGA